VRAWVLVLIPLVASAEPPPYGALFEAGRTWTYDVTTTTYDIDNWGPLTRPPKVTKHSTVTCTATATAITCDGPLEPPVAGTYELTPDGLARDHALLLPAKPRASRKITHDDAMHADRIEGVRARQTSWCTFDDSTDVELDGAAREQCFGAQGVTSGDFDGGGGDWRKVSYRLKSTMATRAAPAARTP
jgi:hypothetical protein